MPQAEFDTKVRATRVSSIWIAGSKETVIRFSGGPSPLSPRRERLDVGTMIDNPLAIEETEDQFGIVTGGSHRHGERNRLPSLLSQSDLERFFDRNRIVEFLGGIFEKEGRRPENRSVVRHRGILSSGFGENSVGLGAPGAWGP